MWYKIFNLLILLVDMALTELRRLACLWVVQDTNNHHFNFNVTHGFGANLSFSTILIESQLHRSWVRTRTPKKKKKVESELTRHNALGEICNETAPMMRTGKGKSNNLSASVVQRDQH